MAIEFPNLSNRFDAEDIRKLREYNSLKHSKMTHKEILDDIRQGAEAFMSEYNSFFVVSNTGEKK
jgi:hypothetical protein